MTTDSARLEALELTEAASFDVFDLEAYFGPF
jgi:hypothetical protein